VTGGRPLAFALLVFVAASTWLVYVPALGFEFVRYDDPEYVSENPQVRQGVTAQSLRWALTASHGANWHPLTSLSHLVDVELYGLDPGRHHRTNVLLHMLNAMLVFAVLRAMTGACWRSLIVALLFALHPLHVESVAWVSERKDLLCCAFGLLSLAAYVRFARRGSWLAYGAAALLLGVGLLSKPMLVTWPFVFLLFDDWPLGRISGAAARAGSGGVRTGLAHRTLEKLPLLLLALGSSIVTYSVQRSAGAMVWSEGLSLWDRVANIPPAYLHYIRKAIWPESLAVLYPHPSLPGGTPPSLIEFALASLLLTAITALVLRLRDRGYLRVGWLFFLGTLVPVIGIVQVGAQAAADRYTYIPLLGLFIAFSWSVGEWVERRPASVRVVARAAAVCGLVVVLGSFGYASRLQLAHWQNSLVLFESTLAVTGPNPVIENELGAALQQQDDHERAIDHFRAALAIHPDDANTFNNLAVSLLSSGQPGEGQRALRRAIALDATHSDAYLNLGLALLQGHEIAEAERALSTAVQLDPGSSAAASGLARALLIHPDPGSRDPERALALAQRALELSSKPADSIVLDTLASAYAGVHRFDEAVAVAARALRLARASGDPDAGVLSERLRRLKQLRLAEKRQPKIEPRAGTPLR
jgi:cytochrome c-type biogenesis protein CcmH/NrfG